MKDKKLMIICDWYFPGFKAGGPIQSCRNLVGALKDQFEFFVFTSDRDFGDSEPYTNVTTNQWVEISTAETVYYSSPEKYSINLLLGLVKKIKPEVIYLNSMFSVRFTLIPLWLKWRGKINSKIVLAPRGMLHEGALQYKPLKKKIFLTFLRISGIPSIIDFHATDEQEVADISSKFPSAKSIVKAPNFPNTITPSRPKIEKQPHNLLLVYFSRISPKKNLLFLLELFTKNRFSGYVTLTIAGEIEDKNYWEKCMETASKFPANIKFEYVGAINHEYLLNWLQQFHFLFLPTFGENFGHAIFEAFIAGKPVIISDKTPWRDLEKKGIGWDISLSDEVGFVNALSKAIAMNEEQYNVMSNKCAEFADAYRNNNETRKLYLEIFS